MYTRFVDKSDVQWDWLFSMYGTPTQQYNYVVWKAVQKLDPSIQFSFMELCIELTKMFKYWLETEHPLTVLFDHDLINHGYNGIPFVSIVKSVWSNDRHFAMQLETALDNVINNHIHDLHKVALLQALIDVQCIAQTPEIDNKKGGICTWVSRILTPKLREATPWWTYFDDSLVTIVLKRLFTECPWYSGNPTYPIPGPWYCFRTSADMYHSTHDLWSGRYGKTRRKVLNWLIVKLTKEVYGDNQTKSRSWSTVR